VPILILLIIVVLFVLLAIVMIPVGIVQRYRVGTRRQKARGWVATLNVFGLLTSTTLFLVVAGLTSVWVPDVLQYTAAGLAGGAVLGLLGLAITKWESGLDALHYTPNRLLVLGLTLIVSARILYGLWRTWESWRAGLSGGSWFVAAGLAGAMAAGAVVLGYYLVYWFGVRSRLRRHGRRALRRI
jgi:hypothetical protein